MYYTALMFILNTHKLPWIYFSDCANPHIPTNGSVSLSLPGITTYGAKAKHSCDEAHDLTGDEAIICEASGSWSGSATCEIKGCISFTMTLHNCVDCYEYYKPNKSVSNGI